MTPTLEELQTRVEMLEHQIAEVVRQAGSGRSSETPGNAFDEWLERRGEQTAAVDGTRDVRVAIGIPLNLPRISAVALQELMLAEGVDPDDRILSREIIRIREESRP